MLKYKPINSFLVNIPKAIRDESDESELLYHGAEAYRELNIPSQLESKVILCEIKDHKVQLPEDIHSINLVTYLCEDPCTEDMSSLSSCVTDNTTTEDENIVIDGRSLPGSYSLAHELFIHSAYYNNNFQPLKYIGNNNSSLCKACLNKMLDHCNDTFSVDYNKVLTTSLKEGFLCIDYDREVRNEDGELMIIDLPEVRAYLSSAAIFRQVENRAFSSEQGAISLYDRTQRNFSTATSKCRGALLLAGINYKALKEINTDSQNERLLTRLPKLYLNARRSTFTGVRQGF